MPNPNIASVSPIWFGLACSWRSSSGRQIWSRPAARVEKVNAATRPPLRLRIRESVMVGYLGHRAAGRYGRPLSGCRLGPLTGRRVSYTVRWNVPAEFGGGLNGKRLKVGVIGGGLIAQVMHLHYLRELSDRFEIAAICDLSAEVAGRRRSRIRASPSSSTAGRSWSRSPSTPSSS